MTLRYSIFPSQSRFLPLPQIVPRYEILLSKDHSVCICIYFSSDSTELTPAGLLPCWPLSHQFGTAALLTWLYGGVALWSWKLVFDISLLFRAVLMKLGSGSHNPMLWLEKFIESYFFKDVFILHMLGLFVLDTKLECMPIYNRRVPSPTQAGFLCAWGELSAFDVSLQKIVVLTSEISYAFVRLLFHNDFHLPNPPSYLNLFRHCTL